MVKVSFSSREDQGCAAARSKCQEGAVLAACDCWETRGSAVSARGKEAAGHVFLTVVTHFISWSLPEFIQLHVNENYLTLINLSMRLLSVCLFLYLSNICLANYKSMIYYLSVYL